MKLEHAVTDMCTTERDLIIVSGPISQRRLEVHSLGYKTLPYSVLRRLANMAKPMSPYAVTSTERGHLFVYDETTVAFTCLTSIKMTSTSVSCLTLVISVLENQLDYVGARKCHH